MSALAASISASTVASKIWAKAELANEKRIGIRQVGAGGGAGIH